MLVIKIGIKAHDYRGPVIKESQITYLKASANGLDITHEFVIQYILILREDISMPTCVSFLLVCVWCMFAYVVLICECVHTRTHASTCRGPCRMSGMSPFIALPVTALSQGLSLNRKLAFWLG